MRKYLNGEFFNDFTEEDKSKIIPTIVANCDNPWFGTIGGDDTMDKKDVNNAKRKSSYWGYIWWWWLRSPGRKQVKGAYVHCDGNIGIQGNGALKSNLSGVYHRKLIEP